MAIFAGLAGSQIKGDEAVPVGVAEPVPFWDAFERNVADQTEVRNAGVRKERFLVEAWDRHREAEKLAGRKLPMSYALGTHGDSLSSPMNRFTAPLTAGLNARILGYPGALDDDAYEAELAKIGGVETREAMMARIDADMKGISARAQESYGTLPGTAGGFLGAMAGSMMDPTTAVTTVATGGAGAGRSLATRMLAQAAANAGTEALTAPERVDQAARFGGPAYSAKDAAADVGFAAVAGAGFEVAGAAAKGVVKGVAKGVTKGAAKPGPSGLIQQTVVEPPEVSRAAQLVEQGERDDLAIGAQRGEDQAEAARRLELVQPPPRIDPARDLSQMPDRGQVDYYGRPIHAQRFDPMALEVDPARFQYKADGDAEGVTARLRGIEAWDATASGKVIVWEDRAGTQFVADGHQRRGLARRMSAQGWDADLDGFLLREADGWTSTEARTVAALKNIREGSGSILDAAKIFRDAPETLADRSLPVTGEFMQMGRGLAKLSDEAFSATVNKVIPERYAAEIGLNASHRPELHQDMVALMREAAPSNVDEARSLVIESLQEDWIRREGDQADLFGYDPSTSALIARAKIAATVKRELASDARLFKGLIRHADAIEAGGNALARDANEARLAVDRTALEVTSKLALRHGPVGEAMSEAVAAVARGETPAKAARSVLARVRQAIEDGEKLDQLRGEMIDPPAPAPAARALVEPFDEVGGAGAKAQAEPAPEDVDLENGQAIPGLFDDLEIDEGYGKAHEALLACVA